MVRRIVFLLIPFVLFFSIFDPVVKEAEKGKKAFNDKKFQDALKHYKNARDIISFSDGFLMNSVEIENELNEIINVIKGMNAETLKFSELKKDVADKFVNSFGLLSKNLNRYYGYCKNFQSRAGDETVKNLIGKLLSNINNLLDDIDGLFVKKNNDDIGKVYKNIVYLKSQINQLNSKIRTLIQNKKQEKNLIALKYNIGSSYYKDGNYKNAKSEFESIKPGKFNKSDIYYNLGNTYFKLKDYNNAIKYFKKSLKANPNDEQARQNYELTLEMIKKQKKQDKKNNKNNKEKNDKKQDNKDKKKKDKKDNENKDKKKEDREKSKEKEDKKKQDKEKQNENKQKKNSGDKKKQEEQKNKKKEQEKKKTEKKPQKQHKNILRFIKQNEKKQLKKMLLKNKYLKGIKKKNKKVKDW